jgi:hypothetical protein
MEWVWDPGRTLDFVTTSDIVNPVVRADDESALWPRCEWIRVGEEGLHALGQIGMALEQLAQAGYLADRSRLRIIAKGILHGQPIASGPPADLCGLQVAKQNFLQTLVAGFEFGGVA